LSICDTGLRKFINVSHESFKFVRSKISVVSTWIGTGRTLLRERGSQWVLGFRDIIATCRFHSLQWWNERKNEKYREIDYEEDKERETENARESRDIVLRYFVMRSPFAGVKKSRSTTLATYIGYNDAIRLTLARAIGKRAEQWPIKTPSRASVITRDMHLQAEKAKREEDDAAGRGHERNAISNRHYFSRLRWYFED